MCNLWDIRAGRASWLSSQAGGKASKAEVDIRQIFSGGVHGLSFAGQKSGGKIVYNHSSSFYGELPYQPWLDVVPTVVNLDRRLVRSIYIDRPYAGRLCCVVGCLTLQ